MKKFIHIAVVTCTVYFAACSPIDIVDSMNQLKKGDVESIKIIAHSFEGAETISRTSVEVGSDGAVFEWVENDTIGIFPDTGHQIAFSMKNGAGSQTAEFNGGGWALNSDSRYAAYYPFNYNNKSLDNITFTYVGQKQEGNGSTDHLGAFDYMAASAGSPVGNQVTFDFKHLGVLIQWKLKIPSAANLTSLSLKSIDSLFVKNAKLNLNNSEPVIEASEKCTSLNMGLCGIQTTGNGQEVVVYMMMAPMDLTGKTYTIQVTDNYGNCATAELEGKAFEVGKAYSLSVELSDFVEESFLVDKYIGKVLSMEGSQLSLEVPSGAVSRYMFLDNAQEWISLVSSSQNNYVFQVHENKTNSTRRGLITFRNLVTDQTIEYAVLQGGQNSYAITEPIGRMPMGILTSNHLPTSDEHGLFALVDGNLNTYFEANTSTELYVNWEGPYVIKVQSYDYSQFGSDCGTKDHTLHVSTDGTDWHGLGWGVSHGGFTEGSNFYTSRAFSYRSRFFRYISTENCGGPTTRIPEFGLIEDTDFDNDIETLNDLLILGDNYTNHPDTPMGNYFVNNHVTTDSDRQWLSNAVNDPSPLNDYYSFREYEVNLYPYGSPLPIDVNHCGLSNRSLAAVLAEMAYLYPNFIKSIIIDHKSKIYTVKMYDPQGMPVNVTVNSTFLGNHDEMKSIGGKDGQANWATVMEKAIMKWNDIYQVFKNIRQIKMGHVLTMFTGDGTSFNIGINILSSKQLNQAVNVAFNNGLAVIGVFRKSGLDVNGIKVEESLEYSVMLSSRSGALFAMRNPNGCHENGSEGDDGVLHIMNNETIPPTIELHFFYPGDASNYLRNKVTPYVVPDYL